ncbi:hybrid sensor histidine kinase/response regulator [Piscinibacter terrae]|uniref:Chemotaxis protein CheA n=1 Tax=Piscinibacter terrae TaxID=2496871 RepID=A0A3N7HL73_9BURK|nr:response regulator [Albitalea terrae]RQP22854.1 hybrid sensor histidine kinase/response regulator [Albitalea terrae]
MEDEKFLKMLLQTFAVEAREHLDAMSTLLLELERQAPGARASGAETLFREAHSLKGAARSVNLAEVERVCQAMERVLSALKRGEQPVTPAFFEAMHAAVDGVGRLVARDVGEGAAVEAGLAVTLSRMVLQLLEGEAAAGAAIPLVAPAAASVPEKTVTPVAAAPFAAEPIAAAPVAGADTVRIATAKLDALMAQAQELQALKLGGAHLADETQAILDMFATWRRGHDKRSGHSRMLRRAGVLDKLENSKNRRLLERLLDASETDELFLKSLADRLGRLARAAVQDRRLLSSRIDRLADEVRQVSMLPFSSLLASAPKLVRDLAHDSGKDVAVDIQGMALEADRRILEQLKTPLTHLLRNALDHGIELPQQRVLAGKPPRGRLVISVSAHEGARIALTLADDGAGVNVDKVRARALKMGLRTEDQLARMAPDELQQLILESGLSTSPILTDLSGHGLGLAIVREKVEALGGTISVAAGEGGIGTRFGIVLPSMLATFRGLQVRCGGQAFMLPSRQVERVLRIEAPSVDAGGEAPQLLVDGEHLRLVSLSALLGLKERVRPDDASRFVQVVVVANAGERLAFTVEEVVGDQEMLVQPLVPPLRRVPHISAATVLGGGQVVPLLSVPDLFKSALAASAMAWPVAPRAGDPVSLLVAEDSVTARTQLREILESAGYRVTTAADGMEALDNLQSGDYDLLVTDVEMPRLDGFGLTARVRRDERLSQLPVILVTALDSREDKERGVEVGANAYIVKRGFSQQRLLDTIRTLL